jgi:hypothetical protein
MFMRFLISVIDDELGTGTPEEMSAIDVFNDNLRAEGFWLIDVPDEQTARDLARGGSQACNRIVELRPLLD